MNRASKPWQVSLPVILLLLAFGLQLFRLDAQSIWWDEGHSIFVASHPISQIPTLPAMDVHPPAYFALLHGWMVVAGRSEFALRMLSVLFALPIVALMWRFAREMGHWPVQVVAAALTALSPMMVAYAQEVRGYTMITFLALASTFFLWRLVLGHRVAESQSRRKDLAAYIFFTTACLYTHYFTIFLLLFQNLVWLAFLLLPQSSPSYATPYSLSPASKKITRWLGSQVAILLLFTPQLALALRQVSRYVNPNLAPPSLPHYLSHSWQAYTTGLTIDPTPARWAMLALAGVLVISWTLVFIIQRGVSHFSWRTGEVGGSYPPNPPACGAFNSFETHAVHNSKFVIQNFSFLLGWLLIPVAAYFIVLQRRPSFEPRYLMWVVPAIFLLLAVGLSELLPPAASATRNVQHALRPPARRAHLSQRAVPGGASVTHYTLLLTTLVALLTGLYSYYTNEAYFKDDSAGVARWLAQNTTANDIIFVDVPHPFHYYAERRQIPAPLDYLFVDVHTAADILNHTAAGRDRLFWVTWSGSDTDPRQVIPFLAEKTGRLDGQVDFKGYRITWFDLPPAAHFSLPTHLTPTQATFGDVLRLDGAAFGRAAAGPVWATLHFLLLHPTDTNYKVSLRLRDATGQVVGQVDRDLLNDRHFKTAAWPADDPALNQAINVYLLPVPPQTPPGSYQLEAVVYNAEPPYPAEGVTGIESADGVAATLGTVAIGDE